MGQESIRIRHVLFAGEKEQLKSLIVHRNAAGVREGVIRCPGFRAPYVAVQVSQDPLVNSDYSK
jgi:hypothetical protein